MKLIWEFYRKEEIILPSSLNPLQISIMRDRFTYVHWIAFTCKQASSSDDSSVVRSPAFAEGVAKKCFSQLLQRYDMMTYIVCRIFRWKTLSKYTDMVDNNDTI